MKVVQTVDKFLPMVSPIIIQHHDIMKSLNQLLFNSKESI